ALSRDCGVESGGWVFGSGAFPWDRRIEVSFVTGPGAKAKHAPDWLELDYDLLLARQRERRVAHTPKRFGSPAFDGRLARLEAALAAGRSGVVLGPKAAVHAALSRPSRRAGRGLVRLVGLAAAADGVDRPAGRSWSCRLRAGRYREDALGDRAA